MFELFGLLLIKICGHGWLWHRGEHIDSDEIFGNGGLLLDIGFIGMIVLTVVGMYVLYLISPQ